MEDNRRVDLNQLRTDEPNVYDDPNNITGVRSSLGNPGAVTEEPEEEDLGYSGADGLNRFLEATGLDSLDQVDWTRLISQVATNPGGLGGLPGGNLIMNDLSQQASTAMGGTPIQEENMPAEGEEINGPMGPMGFVEDNILTPAAQALQPNRDPDEVARERQLGYHQLEAEQNQHAFNVAADEMTTALIGGVADAPIRLAQAIDRGGDDLKTVLGIAEPDDDTSRLDYQAANWNMIEDNETVVGGFGRALVNWYTSALLLRQVPGIGSMSPLAPEARGVVGVSRALAGEALISWVNWDADEEGNLSNMLRDQLNELSPGLGNSFVTALAHNDEDNIWVQRVKNLMEDGTLDIAGRAVIGMVAGINAVRAGKRAGKPKAEALEDGVDAMMRSADETTQSGKTASQIESQLNDVPDGTPRKYEPYERSMRAHAYPADEVVASQIKFDDFNDLPFPTASSKPIMTDSMFEAMTSSRALRMFDETVDQKQLTVLNRKANQATRKVLKDAASTIDVDEISAQIGSSVDKLVGQSLVVIKDFVGDNIDQVDGTNWRAFEQQVPLNPKDPSKGTQPIYNTPAGAVALKTVIKDTARQIADLGTTIDQMVNAGADSTRQLKMLNDRLIGLLELNKIAAYDWGMTGRGRQVGTINVKSAAEGDDLLTKYSENLKELFTLAQKGDQKALTDYHRLARSLVAADGNPKETMNLVEAFFSDGPKAAWRAAYNSMLSNPKTIINLVYTVQPAFLAIENVFTASGYLVRGTASGLFEGQPLKGVRYAKASAEASILGFQSALHDSRRGRMFSYHKNLNPADSSGPISPQLPGKLDTGTKLKDKYLDMAVTDSERTAAGIVGEIYDFPDKNLFNYATRQIQAGDRFAKHVAAKQEIIEDFFFERLTQDPAFSIKLKRMDKAPIQGPKQLPPVADTRGGKRYFHGAAKKFDLDAGGQYSTDANIYGYGLYTTDDFVTANKYRKKNKSKGAADEGVVYDVDMSNQRMFDLDKTPNQKVIDALRFDAAGGERYDAMADLIDDSIANAGPNGTLAEIFDQMRDGSRSFEVPRYEIMEVMSDVQDYLVAQGYTGWKHEGGRLAGKGKRTHDVKIIFNPSETSSISLVEDLNLDDFVAQPPKMRDPMEIQNKPGLGYNQLQRELREEMALKMGPRGQLVDDTLATSGKRIAMQGDLPYGLERLSKAIEDVPLLKHFFPFVKGPINSNLEKIRYTPVMQTLSRTFWNDLLGKNGRRAAARGMGRVVATQGMVWPVIGLSLNGRMTGSQDGPNGEPKKSILIGDRWISYGWLEPLATGMALTSDATRLVRYGDYDGYHEIVGGIMISLASVIQENPYFQGFQDITGIVQRLEQASNSDSAQASFGDFLLSELLQVPDNIFMMGGARRQLGRALAPHMTYWEGFTNARIEAAIPGWQAINGTGRVDIMTGEMMQNDQFILGGPYNIVNNFTRFNVTPNPSDKYDPLRETFLEMDFPISDWSRTDEARGVELTPEDKQALDRLTYESGWSDRALALIQNPRWRDQYEYWIENVGREGSDVYMVEIDQMPFWGELQELVDGGKRYAIEQYLYDNPDFRNRVRAQQIEDSRGEQSLINNLTGMPN